MDLTELMKIFGLPGALVVIAVLAFYTRKIRTAAEIQEIQDRHNKERAEDAKLLQKTEEEKNRWMDLALRNSGLLDRAVEVNKKAVSLVAENRNNQS